jgi:energy-coupling factor transporter ATP-binding protein EcfA2
MPSEGSYKRPRIDYLTPEETERLLKASDDPRTTALITLCLNAGLFLNELARLKLDSINWEERALQVPGKRARAIKLDAQTYEALAAWSHERPAIRNEALFVGLRKEPLQRKGMQIVLENHGLRCGLRCKLTTNLLRNTFVIRLLSQKDLSISEVAALSSFSSTLSLDRFIKAAKAPLPSVPEQFDKRSNLRRAVSRVFPVKPKKVQRLAVERPPLPAGQTLFDRESVITEIKGDIARRNSVLLTGPLGIGKTELLSHLAKLYPAAFKIDAPVPARGVLAQVLNKVCPKKKLSARACTRVPTGELLSQIEAAGRSDLLLLIDNLDRVKAPEAELFARLVDNFTVVAASGATPARLQPLWDKFRHVRLKNLRPEIARQMVRHLTADLPIDDREMLETRIVSLSNGLPLAIVGMVRQVNHEPVIDKDVIRDVYHEAGVRYRDWTPFLVILWGVALASRFVSLGTHSYEGYILAGVGAAMLMTTIRFLRMIK